MIIIADTSAFLASVDANNPDRTACLHVLQEVGEIFLSPMVLAEVDYLARQRYGAPGRQLLGSIYGQIQNFGFNLAEVDRELIAVAQSVRDVYESLDLDLADAVNVALADRYDTVAILTLDRRDFRAIRPLTDAPSFQILPDDL